MTNKQLIKEVLAEDTITRICVWDFDGTLVNTVLPDEAKKIWLEKTGTKWPHTGHWSKPESLDMDVFDMPVIPSVIADYKIERSKPNVLMVMLTGRIPKLGSYVEKILAAKGLTFDRYIYNHGGPTITSKIATLDTLMKEFPKVTSLAMWEDRQPHVLSFRAYGDILVKDGRLQNFDVTQVQGNHHA